MNITEKKLIFLGFKRQEVSQEDSGDNAPFYYYTYDIKDLCLISNTNDDCVKNKWYVELYDYTELGKFRDINKLYDFIKILKSLRK
jgi:hypothetical protein